MQHVRLTALLLSLPLACAPALARGTQPAALLSEPADDTAYSAGVRAIHEQRWQDAVRAFDQVIATRETHRADAALYWKAYALNKLAARHGHSRHLRPAPRTVSRKHLEPRLPDAAVRPRRP